MKPIKLISLLALFSSISANANIIFPGEHNPVATSPVNSSTSSNVIPPIFSILPLTFYDGYTIKDGIFRSEVNICTVAIDNPQYEAKLIWEGRTPKIMILGNTIPDPCRGLATSIIELDLTQFLKDIPINIFQHLEVANRVQFLHSSSISTQ
ncbi:hypothetical protein DLR65_06255 [Vibrio tarriae]|uniref:hypothetical protein n=1 Tax=Vibrio tarriae TaxID=2014742 RepID=UPI000DE3665F|nr:hypothetical protein [Vibrio tarriae]RBM50735.1 hypothetical protein DLR65_06255 [Vibrio tarriae]